ncbi:activator of HSP90 ATPase [Actinorhabdospora filicis]|uniref:Activator of HSP90 ATPase n=1 Tax=Actinorhabdospora filicis TaxID=1785913 RepID=A0A9W6SFN2_9ACTN|nr:SRPBCC domain-containing protein [Actinorhabdospora filicis]GLZ76285.1 activator of HSP90 ATPase [Actinorhabdospora filicis]
MTSSRVRHGQVTHTRVVAATPAEVFAAFGPPLRLDWFRIPGSLGHEIDYRVGGGETASGAFTPDAERELIEYSSRYLDLVPGERIVFAYGLAVQGVRRQAALVTIELSAVDGGTALSYTEQYALTGFDGDGERDARHQEGSIPLLLNRLDHALAR